MGRKWPSNLQERNFRLLIITYFSILVLSVLSISLGSQSLIKKVIYQNSTEILHQFSYHFENELDSGIALAVQASQDTSVEQLALYSSLDYSAQSSGMKQLINYVSVCKEVDSLYVYNGLQRKFYLSSPVPGNDNLVIPLESLSDRQAIDYILKYGEYPVYTPIPRQVSFPDGTTKNYYTIIGYSPYLDVSKTGSLKRAVIVNLSVDWIDQISQNRNVDGEFFIVDKNGRTISNCHLFSMSSDLSGEEFVTASFSADNYLYDIINLNGEKYFIAHTTPNSYGWRYYWAIPYDNITKQINSLWILITVLGVFLTGLSFFIISRLSRSINEPISHMQSDLEHTRTNLTLAESAQRENYFQLRQNFLYHILISKEMHSSKSFALQSETYDLTFPFEKNYCVLLFRIVDRQTFSHENSIEEQNAILYALINLITELSEDYLTECIRVQNSPEIIVLLTSDIEGRLCREAVIMLADNVLQHTEKILSISLFCAASEISSELKNLPHLYSQVRKADLYHLIFPRSEVLFYSDFAPRNSISYIYPEQLEKRLIEFINKGDFEQAKSCYFKIVESSLSYSYQSINIALTRLSLAINVSLSDQGNDDFLPNNQQSTFSISLADMETLDQVNNHFTEAISFICELSRRKHNERHKKIAEQVDILIQQNYSDPSLCIDSIASKIGLSADYLSRIYRQETGTSILERIISVRMDRARAMLSTTSETIQIIASSVGYINLSYFYKLFKKENGVTPAEYRKRHRKEGN